MPRTIPTEDLENTSNEEETAAQPDDGEASSPVPTASTSGLNSPEQMVEALTDMLSKLIVGKSQAEFDLDAFTVRVMKKNQYREVCLE